MVPTDFTIDPAFATVAVRMRYGYRLITCRYELGALEVGPSHQRLLEGNARQVFAVIIRVLDVHPTRNCFPRSCSNGTKQFQTDLIAPTSEGWSSQFSVQLYCGVFM